MKVRSKKDLTQDYVISKFYYSFDIDEDETTVILGLHQEDKRNLGSHLRPYLDASMIVLKRSDEDEDELEYFAHAEFSRDREFFARMVFDEGSYIVVPFTSGTLLQRIDTNTEEAKQNKVSLKEASKRKIELEKYYGATINDIFRKIDMSANGILSAKELNQFGIIVDNKKFKDIKQSDFTSEKFKNISCTKEGLTRHGLSQFFFHNFDQKEITKMLEKLGYDEMLHSLKSRVFVITFHAEEALSVKIHDILEGNMHKTATDLFIDHLIKEGGEDIEEDNETSEDIRIVKFLEK